MSSRRFEDVITIPSFDGSTFLTLSLSPIEAVPRIFLYRGDRTVLSGCVTGLPSLKTEPYTLSCSTIQSPASIDLVFTCHSGSLRITQNGSSSFSLTLESGSSPAVQASFSLSDQHWFGLGHLMHQHWPLEQGRLELGPFYPFDNGPNGICTLLDPTLISTSGALVVADDTSRCLHLALNASTVLDGTEPLRWGTGVANFNRTILPAEDKDGRGDRMLTLQSRAAYDWHHVSHPWKAESDGHTRHKLYLKFSIGATDNVREASKVVLRQIKEEMQLTRHKPPPVNMMKNPIWSTWARYKDAVTQQDVLDFAYDIVQRGLPRSVMGIDDRWSVKYGDLDFDKLKFPDPKGMIDKLHELGFVVTVWVTPFANTDSHAVLNANSRKYFVQTKSGDVGEFEWWQPTKVAALDVTNPEACKWFLAGLNSLRERYGLDGFKFDAGEPSFLPNNSVLEETMLAPSDYTRAWINNVASEFEIAEVRSGVRGCQKAAPMFRLFDRFSTWGLQNGLASMLAGVLTSGMLGYPFCIPDYIAGNAYGDEVPDAELMIRWAQASAAMPAMQFSIPPWSMGEECEKYCEDALRWRERFFWQRIEECIEDAAVDYIPIVRPMWWEEPDLEGVAKIFDQFMLGSNLVVAPVVNKGQRDRDMFLPSGTWQRVNFDTMAGTVGSEIIGPMWLTQVSATLAEMPTFERIA